MIWHFQLSQFYMFLCDQPNDSKSIQDNKKYIHLIGKAFSYSDPETSSDSEEDALRRLNSRSHPPPDTLTIQAEDGPTTIVGQCNNDIG